MDYLPIFLKLTGRKALVVGGGPVAARKAELILAAGPVLTVVAPELSRAMRDLIATHPIEWLPREFAESDLEGMKLALAATDSAAVNHAVFKAAEARDIPVNVADQPELCSFILPAIVDRSPAIVAISTGGRSPVLARYLKSLLERQLPFGLPNFTALLGDVRNKVKATLKDSEQRRRFWDHVIDGPIGDAALAGQLDDARRRIHEELDCWDEEARAKGSVYLIGAGPGDPELLTLRGQRLLQRADVVLYDRLIPTRLLELCRREAELIYVGKQAKSHVVSQQTIGELLVAHALQGKCVARLKGGDPFVFGRGGEELADLIAAGIDFQVVPGISAANGCAAYAGIPLTHRDHAAGVSFWTGHMKDGVLQLPWAQMSVTNHTHVFFMGLKSLPRIAEQLCLHGLDPETPAAMISAGTTPAQKVVVASISALPERAAQADLPSPALLIVGDVVGLHDQIGWFAGAELPLDRFPFPSHD